MEEELVTWKLSLLVNEICTINTAKTFYQFHSQGNSCWEMAEVELRYVQGSDRKGKVKWTFLFIFLNLFI